MIGADVAKGRTLTAAARTMREAELPGPKLLRASSDRDRSLDVFRGATVAAMILVNNPGNWDHLYAPLAHAAWHGWTPTDLVFPFFLFAVGNALALTMPANRAPETSGFWPKWLRRTLLIFGIGLLLNAWPFVRWSPDGALQLKDFSALRIMGVLQRIALCWAIAALVIRAGGIRAASLCSALLLVGYTVACLAFANGPDPWSLEGFFGTALDRALLGETHLYHGEGVPFDPEGLGSTPPAIAQVLLGYIVGDTLLRCRQDPGLIRKLVFAAATATLVGLAVQGVVPINKKLWSPSYVLLTTGLATATAVLLMQMSQRVVPGRALVERSWRAFEAFGRNALFIFALSGLVPRTLALVRLDDGIDAAGEPRMIALLPWLYREFFVPLAADPRTASLLFALANVTFYWAVAHWMQVRRWYIKV
jgi:predicted acyltransferase